MTGIPGPARRSTTSVVVAGPTEHLPGADVHVTVEPRTGGHHESGRLSVIAVEVFACGCRVLVLDRPIGGTVRLRVDDRPADSRGRCTREHVTGSGVPA